VTSITSDLATIAANTITVESSNEELLTTTAARMLAMANDMAILFETAHRIHVQFGALANLHGVSVPSDVGVD
jgi:hypothetical protein